MQTRKYIMRKRNLFMMLLTLLIMNPAWSDIIKSRVIEEGGTGPYSALMLAEASLPTHTVFRPQDVSQFGADNPLPLIVWGNGACFDSPWEHINFLNEIASYGFLVIATGILDRKSTRLNSSHVAISYAVFCLKKKKQKSMHNR